ncbi:hypothetical protein [Vulcanisaeta thermophila]|uniref:hypothetical protein n=1 Tax=Vulcanisaeta thermophila TaxID=867917 RepID=UPI000852BCDB|nr:hypothetical protein [Vulcanisaeta thermophila]
MKPLLLLAIVGLAFAGGVMAAGFMGYGPLAFITYNVVVPSVNATTTVIPAYLNLGNLTPGASGSVTANAKVTIGVNGTYTIELTHEDALDHVFSVFNVTVSIGNETVTLNLEHDEAKVYLTAGTYDVTITVNYLVKTQPEPPYTVHDMPFLVLHLKGDHEDHGVGGNSQVNGISQGGDNDNEGD